VSASKADGVGGMKALDDLGQASVVEIGQTSVAKYMARMRKPPSQGSRTNT
jgi:hypothetical protein